MVIENSTEDGVKVKKAQGNIKYLGRRELVSNRKKGANC